MLTLEKLNETSSMTTYRAVHRQSVRDVLEKLNLQTNFFAVLVNGRKADLHQTIEKDDEVLILPKIAGG